MLFLYRPLVIMAAAFTLLAVMEPWCRDWLEGRAGGAPGPGDRGPAGGGGAAPVHAPTQQELLAEADVNATRRVIDWLATRHGVDTARVDAAPAPPHAIGISLANLVPSSLQGRGTVLDMPVESTYTSRDAWRSHAGCAASVFARDDKERKRLAGPVTPADEEELSGLIGSLLKHNEAEDLRELGDAVQAAREDLGDAAEGLRTESLPGAAQGTRAEAVGSLDAWLREDLCGDLEALESFERAASVEDLVSAAGKAGAAGSPGSERGPPFLSSLRRLATDHVVLSLALTVSSFDPDFWWAVPLSAWPNRTRTPLFFAAGHLAALRGTQARQLACGQWSMARQVLALALATQRAARAGGPAWSDAQARCDSLAALETGPWATPRDAVPPAFLAAPPAQVAEAARRTLAVVLTLGRSVPGVPGSLALWPLGHAVGVASTGLAAPTCALQGSRSGRSLSLATLLPRLVGGAALLEALASHRNRNAWRLALLGSPLLSNPEDRVAFDVAAALPAFHASLATRHAPTAHCAKQAEAVVAAAGPDSLRQWAASRLAGEGFAAGAAAGQGRGGPCAPRGAASLRRLLYNTTEGGAALDELAAFRLRAFLRLHAFLEGVQELHTRLCQTSATVLHASHDGVPSPELLACLRLRAVGPQHLPARVARRDVEAWVRALIFAPPLGSTKADILWHARRDRVAAPSPVRAAGRGAQAGRGPSLGAPRHPSPTGPLGRSVVLDLDVRVAAWASRALPASAGAASAEDQIVALARERELLERAVNTTAVEEEVEVEGKEEVEAGEAGEEPGRAARGGSENFGEGARSDGADPGESGPSGPSGDGPAVEGGNGTAADQPQRTVRYIRHQDAPIMSPTLRRVLRYRVAEGMMLNRTRGWFEDVATRASRRAEKLARKRGPALQLMLEWRPQDEAEAEGAGANAEVESEEEGEEVEAASRLLNGSLELSEPLAAVVASFHDDEAAFRDVVPGRTPSAAAPLRAMFDSEVLTASRKEGAAEEEGTPAPLSAVAKGARAADRGPRTGRPDDARAKVKAQAQAQEFGAYM